MVKVRDVDGREKHIWRRRGANRVDTDIVTDAWRSESDEEKKGVSEAESDLGGKVGVAKY